MITGAEVVDIRFPTSRRLDGSDAMNAAPDYSAAYLRLETEAPGLGGSAFAFTLGRGNEIQCAAVRYAARPLIGLGVDEVCERIVEIGRSLVWDSQLRWLGPDKGVMHMALGAVINAMWDLRARMEERPLWQTLAALTPGEIVAMVDFTYISDFLDPGVALSMLENVAGSKDARTAELMDSGIPGYTTSVGWLGYSDEKLRALTQRAVDEGFSTIKLKVGRDGESDRRRLGIARDVVGDDVRIAVDANQVWGVDEAIAAVERLAEFELAWVEEPTHPDDVVGHARIAAAIDPIPVATGEHLANAVLAKQLLAGNGAGILQIDATRVGGVPELVAMMLLAARAGARVYPHAGGVGLGEAVQHLAMFNSVSVAPDYPPLLEYVDNLHEHMADPVRVVDGSYIVSTAPGFGMAFRPEAVERYEFPSGEAWANENEDVAWNL